MDTLSILERAIENGASDILFANMQPVHFRVNGQMVRINDEPLSTEEIHRFLGDISPQEVYEHDMSDFARDVVSFPARLRVNRSVDHNGVTVTVRLLNRKLLTPELLGVPHALVDRVAQAPSGLILISGPTDAGKSTTIASTISAALRDRALHVITIEDPVEYLINPGRGMVNQREIRKRYFPQAIEEAMRQVPDIIVIGELRNTESVQAALMAADSGHLVMCSIHARNAREAISRLANMFPAELQANSYPQIANSLVASLHQRLVRTPQGKGRVMLTELMFNNSATRNIIASNKLNQLNNVMQTGAQQAMHTLQQDLEEKMRRNMILNIDATRLLNEINQSESSS